MSDPIAVITLAEAKAQCRVLHDFEDAYIESLIKVALQTVAKNIDRVFSDPICLEVDENGEPKTPATLAAPLRHAALLIISDLYTNREAQNQSPLTENPAVARLCKDYRRWGL